MNIAGFIVSYAVTWWLLFFIFLPIGSTPNERPEKGHASSAPSKPRLLLKAIAATIFAFPIAFGVMYAMELL